MQLYSTNNLIGDLIGQTPMMIDLAKEHGGLQVKQSLDEGKWIYPFLKKHGIELVDEIDYANPFFTPEIDEAFRFSHEDDLHMSQCWHRQVGLPTPTRPIRADLEVTDIEVPVYDYVFAPFGRSAPDDQKWNMTKWQVLTKSLSDYGFKICMIGNSKHDLKPLPYIEYCKYEFDRPMEEVINILKKATYGCVSIVTGISQLCFATGVKNFVLCNQGGNWGRNPDAIELQTYIPRITVDEVMDLLMKQHEKL